MNSGQLAARIYATEENLFIPGYDRKSLMMGKYINLTQLKTKSPEDIAQCIHILSQGSQNIICYNGKGSPLFLSQMNASQIKQVGLTLASGEQNTLIQEELPTFSSVALSSESSDLGVSTNATARLRELLYDAVINSYAGGNMTEFMLYQINGQGPWHLILPNRNLFSNSPADINSSTQSSIEPPIPKKSKGKKAKNPSKQQAKISHRARSVAGIPDDDLSSEEEKKEEEFPVVTEEAPIVDPASTPIF